MTALPRRSSEWGPNGEEAARKSRRTAAAALVAAAAAAMALSNAWTPDCAIDRPAADVSKERLRLAEVSEGWLLLR